MTVSGVNGSGSGARSGTRALVLLAKPLNATIVRRLSNGPTRLVDLRRDCGSPAQTTLRAHLRELEAVNAVVKQRRSRFPGALEYELETPGNELLFVAGVLERWLQQAPKKPLPFGSREAKAAIKALVEGWSSTMLRALAAGPLSLTELDRIIGALNYPSLERRLASMRLVGQVEACPGEGNGTPYAVTAWLRHGIAPLAAATRWERNHLPDDTAPITRVDTETAFLLTLPLLQLSPGLSGSCRMTVAIPNDRKRRPAGVTVEVENGKVASCITDLQSRPDARALGPPSAWLSALIEHEIDSLELLGDCRLARALLEGLHRTLFKASTKATRRRHQIHP